jgi:hypothetical protein
MNLSSVRDALLTSTPESKDFFNEGYFSNNAMRSGV